MYRRQLIISVCFICCLITSCMIKDDTNDDSRTQNIALTDTVRGIDSDEVNEYIGTDNSSENIENSLDPVYVKSQYEKFVQSFSSTVNDKTVYDVLYGGAYYGEDNMLHINLTVDDEAFKQKVFEVVDSKVVVFDIVDYSLNYLMNVYELLYNKMAELSICGVGVSQSMNHVDVEVLTVESIETIKAYLNELELDADCCIFNVGTVLTPALGDE